MSRRNLTTYVEIDPLLSNDINHRLAGNLNLSEDVGFPDDDVDQALVSENEL